MSLVETKVDPAKKTLNIKIKGRFDFGVHHDFRKASELVVGQDINYIVVDMGNVDYIDSSALGMLLVLSDKVGDTKNAVQIKNIKPDVKKVMEIANFDKLFTLS